jgi:ATP-dependent DNA ligase
MGFLTSTSCIAHNEDVFLYAFDLIELNGDDLRKEALERRKAKLERLLVSGGWGLRFVSIWRAKGPSSFSTPAS